MEKIISVIGAGGKTTLLHKIAERYLQKGKTVLLTTTTHMMLEENTDVSCDLFSILNKIKRDGYCMAGTICKENNQKIQALPKELLIKLIGYVDYILIEADGAKHHSLKYPNIDEPVIFEYTTDVILVLGLWELGKNCKEVIFRFDIMRQETDVKETENVSFKHIKLICQAYQKRLNNAGYTGNITCLFSEKKEK